MGREIEENSSAERLGIPTHLIQVFLGQAGNFRVGKNELQGVSKFLIFHYKFGGRVCIHFGWEKSP